MLRLLRFVAHRFYTTWSTFWFVLPFVVTYPAQWVLRRRPTWHPYLHTLNRGWSIFAIRMWGMPVEVVKKNQPPATQPCLYVANHSSYIDIPLLFKAIPGFINIVGKSSLANVPLWGPIFGSTYITVNRESAVSRGRAMIQAKKSLEAGRSVVIFPEGKISLKPGEEMLPFKDGAFQLAIATGVPIVPVSMPLNHRFMPDVAGTLRVRYSPLRIVLHDPIPTTNLTAADVPALKEQAFRIIASEFRPEAAGIPAPSTLRASGAPANSKPASAETQAVGSQPQFLPNS
ncbi:1-acyl-sn-glycerol-3-phosphate acyltransferase [Hymenobacter daecheongensis DSM 21074]|uniref:1-acyl-sn-glycerol-3-phosphate acyltransferase n=1 Tax=Hymenobacter daecheongensis DSM 21074 TaxID=1121955 RepID=A0A1M6CCR4_9BACT|nr:lysophospholipid acyltransferase family protein [Hymenobacter daecheongensis]SHI58508.1 1-acyl-sn-glycerol-3-phosphate acyltransferase [Hymenobacter daecheongensis DSM 21074]